MISTIVFTAEDSSADAEDVMQAVLTKGLLAAESAVPKLVPVVDGVRPTTKATYWYTRRGPRRENRVRLVEYLADLVARAETVVAFHYDADCAWGSTPVVASAFTELRADVAALLALRKHDASLATKLVPIVPHWCMESWTYQHTTEAAAICRDANHEESARRFEAIADDRAALETSDPHASPQYAHLRKKHNRRLATHPGFPAAKLLALEMSFAASIRALAAAIT